LILNVPLVRFWLSLFKIPSSVLFPSILFFCCVGTYGVNNNLEDILITAGFGLLGSVLMRLSLDPAPLTLGFILGPMLEENFRRAMLLGRGSFGIFVTQPISAALMAFIVLLIGAQVVLALVRARARGAAPSGSTSEILDGPTTSSIPGR